MESRNFAQNVKPFTHADVNENSFYKPSRLYILVMDINCAACLRCFYPNCCHLFLSLHVKHLQFNETLVMRMNMEALAELIPIENYCLRFKFQ